LRIDKNDSSRKIISFYSRQSKFLALLEKHFHVFFLKKHALSVQVLKKSSKSLQKSDPTIGKNKSGNRGIVWNLEEVGLQ
jgi:hypothetical protein